MTFIVDAAVLCGAESARNDWRWQQARMENDLILRKLSLNAPIQGRNKYEVGGIQDGLGMLVSIYTNGHVSPRVGGII